MKEIQTVVSDGNNVATTANISILVRMLVKRKKRRKLRARVPSRAATRFMRRSLPQGARRIRGPNHILTGASHDGSPQPPFLPSLWCNGSNRIGPDQISRGACCAPPCDHD